MRHAIEGCFLENFWQKESTYHQCMSQTSLSYGSPWLSCDHTFKSVGNVGTVRAADNHWIKQYAGLFCVMNADGQVLSWKLTKTLTFEDIQDCLLALRERLQKHGEQVEQFFVDTCCSLRSKSSEYIWTATEGILGCFPCSAENHQNTAKATSLPSRLFEITSACVSRPI